MSKTAIIYWSGTGNTESMAQAVLNGARSINPDTYMGTVSEISSADAAEYDTLIMGCPAMGSEELEETEFEPFFSELERSLNNKNVALFGSYGWGGGEWMRTWEQRVTAAGANLVCGSIIVNGEPDSGTLEQCSQLGKIAAEK